MTGDRETYARIGWTLLVGLLLSMAVMIGALLAVAVNGANAAPVLGLDQIWSHLASHDAAAFLDLGILLLFMAPVAGIVVALIQFLREGDRLFAGVAGLLLTVLGVGIGIAVH